MKIEHLEYTIEFLPIGNEVQLSIITKRNFSNFSYDIVVAKKQTSKSLEYTLKGLTINSSLQNPDGPATYIDTIGVDIDKSSLVLLKSKNFQIECKLINNNGQLTVQHLQTVDEK